MKMTDNVAPNTFVLYCWWLGLLHGRWLLGRDLDCSRQRLLGLVISKQYPWDSLQMNPQPASHGCVFAGSLYVLLEGIGNKIKLPKPDGWTGLPRTQLEILRMTVRSFFEFSGRHQRSQRKGNRWGSQWWGIWTHATVMDGSVDFEISGTLYAVRCAEVNFEAIYVWFEHSVGLISRKAWLGSTRNFGVAKGQEVGTRRTVCCHVRLVGGKWLQKLQTFYSIIHKHQSLRSLQRSWTRNLRFRR